MLKPSTCYTHIQTTPASEWVITHGQFSYPIVDVYTELNGDVQKIIPASVVYVDSATVRLLFSTPRTGFATVVL